MEGTQRDYFLDTFYELQIRNYELQIANKYCGSYTDNYYGSDWKYYAFEIETSENDGLFSEFEYWYDMIIVLPTRDDQILIPLGKNITQQIYNKNKNKWI